MCSGTRELFPALPEEVDLTSPRETRIQSVQSPSRPFTSRVRLTATCKSSNESEVPTRYHACFESTMAQCLEACQVSSFLQTLGSKTSTSPSSRSGSRIPWKLLISGHYTLNESLQTAIV
ncbi:hypothetical protein AcW1_007898 [Taiwanofungus camphoratus]|nr:hypothetical protein AcW2_007045 [Antrodia cinnamomea]KAI0953755.1 hypothetical protein AcW1_007898 [Antrodia cinnamomea]